MTLKRLLTISYAIAAAFALSACGEDPALVQKREEQATEITRLRGELKLIEEKLKNLPPDRTEELEAVKLEAEKQTAEAERLEEEVGKLQARKREVEAEFQRYRVRYVAK